MADVADAKVSFIRTRASGDAIPSGELFMAREARPELVGSIGSTATAVDNDRIVSSVASCVERAVASVMGAFAI